MAAVANIRAVITAEDNASKVLNSFSGNVEKSNKKVISGNTETAASFNQVLVATAGLGITTRGLIGVIDDTITAANRYQNAMLGLESITKAFGHDTQAAKNAAQELASDGLMTVADAARGLKNLLASGFSLDQAITLMRRFKDSAAFGRQSALSFGDAVASATEGIKNGNSILVDNAGVTKNLSVILEEAGFSAQDLMKATTDAGIRQALFNGIVKETNANVGDAAKLTQTYAGEQAKLQAKTTQLKESLGTAFQPALAQILEKLTPLIEKTTQFASAHPELTANIILATTAITGLLAVFGAIGLTITGLAPMVGLLGTAWSAMGVAAGGASGAVGALSAALGVSAIALGGVVAASGFAIYELYRLKKAFDDTNMSISNTNRSLDSIDRSLAQAEAQYKAGKITKERYNAILRGAYEGRAGGGAVYPGQAYQVNERGKEMFVPDTPGKIVPNNQAGGQIVNVSLQIGLYAGTEQEKRKVAQELWKALQDVSSMKTAGSMA